MRSPLCSISLVLGKLLNEFVVFGNGIFYRLFCTMLVLIMPTICVENSK